MMAGNPNNWWNMQHNNIRSSSTSDDQQDETEVNPTINLLISQTHPNNSLLPPLQFLHGGSSSSSSSLLPFLVSSAEPHTHDHFPHSWSQLLMGGMGSEEEERYSDPINEYHEARRVLNEGVQLDIKQEISTQNNLELYGNQFNNNNEEQDHHHHHHHHHHQVGVSNNTNNRAASANWTQIIPVSSPKSCITTLNNNTNNNNSNMLDFSTNKRSLQAQNHQHAENTVNSAECNSSSTTNGGVPPKKPRVQSSSTPPLKVRKEKLGDRITALHQLVSPFGKTDTASVLLEAIGYIRFLQGQIEALSSPYMGNNHASAKNQHVVHGERNCLFPDHPGQLLNDSCLKRRGAPNQEDNKDGSKDLKGRGLCLVPISCTQLVGSDNGADYWAQSLGGGF